MGYHHFCVCYLPCINHICVFGWPKGHGTSLNVSFHDFRYVCFSLPTLQGAEIPLMTTTNCAGGYLLQTSECTPPSVSSSPWPQHWPSPSGPSLPRERVVCWESGVDFDHPAARLRVTTMSCSLPPEILDAIIDQLYDEPTSLKACCLVSKSWIPRTQKHLFVHIEFDPPKHSFGSWMRMSPDPSNSPAHRAHSLTILYLPTITFTGTDLCGWTSTFDNVTHLHFERCIWTSHSADLTPFFGFSPALRSLRMTYTSFEVFDLICSFPLLEDLALVDLRPEDGTVWRRAPSISPKLTGSLDLDTTRELHSVTRRLWDFPNGLHFAKIAMSFGIGQDFLLATDLVSRCSSTLESLNIRSSLKSAFF